MGVEGSNPSEAPRSLYSILPEIVKVHGTISCREVDNESLEEEADNQTMEGLSVEHEGIVPGGHAIYVP